MIIFIYRTLLIYLCTVQVLFSSSDLPIDYGALAHEERDPDQYTLVCLYSTMIPKAAQTAELKARTDLNLVRKWLNSVLLAEIENVELDEETTEESNKELLVITKSFKGRPYHVIQLHTSRFPPSSERLIGRLSGKKATAAAQKEFSAGMIVFEMHPSSDRALAYVFGNWNQLCNSYAVVHDWGLRIAASEVIFSDESIKSIWGRNNFDPNPSTRRERKHFLAPIESFALEVGTEGLFSLSLLPKYAMVKGSRCKRLVEGSNAFRFYIAPPTAAALGSTMRALFEMGDYLYAISQRHKAIHPKLRPYIDMEETNSKIVTALNAKLVEILNSPSVADVVFPSDEIWKLYGSGAVFPIADDGDNKKFFKAIIKIKSLDDPIEVRKSSSDVAAKETIGRLIFTLPISLDKPDGSFYRFDRGRWFRISASRFAKIVSLLRSPEVKLKPDAIGLPTYQLEDAQKSEKKADMPKGVDYKEANYNKRVIAALGIKNGILLDRVNVLLGGAGNLFEFGDIFIGRTSNEYYIVHVKRKEAGDIDHHRAQVERCAEYLGTELAKENARDLLLQGCVNGLYLKYGVDIKKVKNQKSRLTHGTYFLNKDKKTKTETYKQYCTRLFKNTPAEAKTSRGKLKIALRKIDLSSFEAHQEELLVVLDTLYDCTFEKEVAEQDIQDFIAAMQELIKVRQHLFPSASIKGDVRKRIHIVMAVIDDRKIDKILAAQKLVEEVKTSKTKTITRDKRVITLKDAEAALKTAQEDLRDTETELFHKQHLWGLDRTRQLVQRYGFRFNLVIINETPRKGWDVFGPMKIEESDDDTASDSEENDSSEGDDESSDSDASNDEGSEEETDLANRFEKTEQLTEGALDFHTPQKLAFVTPDTDQGLYAEYLTCPTIGDGDCFFHAAFTEDGEDESTVCAKAATMRKGLCDAIQSGQYIDDCRPLLYEYYLELYTQLAGGIPKTVRDMFVANAEYDEVRNYLIKKHIPIPAELTQPHTEDDIKAAIIVEHIKQYMENLRVRGSYQTYISVRPGIRCPAQILAERAKKRIHIFTYNDTTRQLGLLKTVGPHEDKPISILLSGNHYIRLYNPDEEETSRNAAQQIVNNAQALLE
jgi:hypothetical protein